MDNQQIAEQLRKPTGENGIQISLKMNQSNAIMTKNTIHSLKLVTGDIVIEVGPGNGLLSLPLFNLIGAQGEYIAIDYSDDMLKATEKNLLKAGVKNFRLINENCQSTNINFPKEFSKANALFAVNVLYFIDDLVAFFKRIHTWLAPNARVAFAVGTKKTMEQFAYTQYGFISRTESYYIDALKKARFDSIKVKKYNDEFISITGNEVKREFLVLSGKTIHAL